MLFALEDRQTDDGAAMTTPPFFPTLPGQGWSVHKKPTFATIVAPPRLGPRSARRALSNPIWQFELTLRRARFGSRLSRPRRAIAAEPDGAVPAMPGAVWDVPLLRPDRQCGQRTIVWRRQRLARRPSTRAHARRLSAEWVVAPFAPSAPTPAPWSSSLQYAPNNIIAFPRTDSGRLGKVPDVGGRRRRGPSGRNQRRNIDRDGAQRLRLSIYRNQRQFRELHLASTPRRQRNSKDKRREQCRRPRDAVGDLADVLAARARRRRPAAPISPSSSPRPAIRSTCSAPISSNRPSRRPAPMSRRSRRPITAAPRSASPARSSIPPPTRSRMEPSPLRARPPRARR